LPRAEYIRYMNGSARGIFAPGDSHGFERTRSLAFDKADVILISRLPCRIFVWVMGDGLRSDAIVVQIDLDYRNVVRIATSPWAWSVTAARFSNR